ncbi:hypothetical protein VP01_3880g3 [Puccinia sorghi]|uniref:Integrase catalytic domain-containing protein n=1 Tax=Puccinia sorghi TaxID=27349 RepID=A0A0L6UUT8_9BASI|nr:hypothetical protein VP01_3880g3 [Puccinia sorghi]
MEEDILTYDLLKQLPSSLDNIKQQITHSPDAADIKPKTLLDHLEIHLNKLKVSNASKGESIATTMYTNDDQRFSSGTHNPNLRTHTKDKCWAIYPEKRAAFLKKKEESQPFLDGHYENNLPILKLEPLSSHSTHLSSGEILHKSLGHVSFFRIRRKLGIPIKASETCKSCAVVKITKASFKHQTSMAEKPFEELHLDLIGPISPLSHKLHKYILTIVDGYTRFVAAIPLTSKSEVFSTLSQVINIEAKRLGYYPSVLHSDRGTEFLNAQVGEFCRTNVIRQRFSDEYTPQQNGLAERFNRTVIKSLRTVMLDSGLKPNLWNEVISS